MGTAEQAITVPHLRLLFFNKTSCSDKVILEVFRIVNLCQSFQKRCHEFDLRSAMQPDLVSLEVLMSGHSCCALHPDAPPRYAFMGFMAWRTSSVLPDCIGRFLGFESFPSDFNYVYLLSLCCSDNFRKCYSAFERSG